MTASNRFAVALAICVLATVPDALGARVTRQCNPNWGVGEVLVRASAALREEIPALVADPSRNPDIFNRLWQPKSVRLSYDYVILAYERVQDTAEMTVAMKADTVLAGVGVLDAWPNTSAGCFSAGPPAQKVVLTEYHNRLLDHYFLSSSAEESAIIDAGGAGAGWEKTGETFGAIVPDYCYDSRPVFRFYGRVPNSHFFTVDTSECGGLRNRDPGWQYEGDAFGAMLPSSGLCPGRTTPIYRLYNNRAAQGDSNHRFVARQDLYAQMQARGWIGEGVAMCLDHDGNDRYRAN